MRKAFGKYGLYGFPLIKSEVVNQYKKQGCAFLNMWQAL